MTIGWDKALVEQGAPTLAGVKAASLFRVTGETQALREDAAWWDGRLRAYGIRLRILKEWPDAGACLIYLYRRKQLSRILADTDSRRFLEQRGYCLNSRHSVLDQLSRRFCLGGEYPHEIGVFLDYPLEDVEGFIVHRGRDFTCCGCWKCYGDPRAARENFSRYRACTCIYRQLYRQGTPVLSLVAAEN